MNGQRPNPHGGMSPHRLNALTDAVFAIGMTLLALELTQRLPEFLPVRTHVRALLLQLFSYGLGFLILGLFWSTHQAQSHYTERTDRVHTWLKIFFLFFVALIPVGASLLNKAMGEPSSIILYGVMLTCAAALNYGQWTYATTGHRLVRRDLGAHVIGSMKRRLATAIGCYLVIMAIAPWNAVASVGLFAALHLAAVFVPAAPPETGSEAQPEDAG
jgi:uncharacterized membrane protein